MFSVNGVLVNMGMFCAMFSVNGVPVDMEMFCALFSIKASTRGVPVNMGNERQLENRL